MNQPLLEPFDLGDLRLPNRVCMAPMTRCRADNPDTSATELIAEYYRQRASAGLLITEGTFVSPRGVGYINVPGIYSPKQTEGWRQVTQAVHEAGGRIFCQLWHVGAMSHPDLLGGRLPLAPSAIDPRDKIFGPNGHIDTVTPQAMTEADIRETIAEFRHAAANAIAAGFDGVELHAANGYLFNQFFARSMNRRSDAFGGSIENRTRFLVDVLEAVGAEISLGRVGVRINPSVHGLSGIVVDDETLPLFEHVCSMLSRLGVAYLHVMEPFNDVSGLPLPQGVSMCSHFRRFFDRPIISATDHSRASGNAALAAGDADLIAYGRAYIANPDLVERFADEADLNVPIRETFYTPGARGYTDYPRRGDGTTPETVSGDRRVSDRYGETRRKMKSGES